MMEAATVERDQAQSATVTFISGDRMLRLVKEQATDKVDTHGRRYPVPGETIEFAPTGILEVEESDTETLEFLRSHPANGNYHKELTEQGQTLPVSEILFYEQELPPDPGEQDRVIAQIIELALSGDAAAIADIYVAESSRFSRGPVLAAAKKALEQIGAETPAPPATPEHEVERVRAEPAVGVTPGVEPLTQPAAGPAAVGGAAVNPAEAQPPAAPLVGPVPTGGAGEPQPAQPVPQPPAPPREGEPGAGEDPEGAGWTPPQG